MAKTVLILGASGLVGGAALQEFLDRDDWGVIAVSRRPPEVSGRRAFRHLAVDLRDAAACRDAFGGLAEVTHVVYAAVFEKPGLIAGWSDPEQMQTNRQMLCNLLEPLVAAAQDLQHITLLQGTKAYGIHLHPMPIPARERSPRDEHENFYWLQEDALREQAARHGFRFTILRPQLVVGGAVGVVMNLVPVIGAYAALRHEQGEPCGFPGGVSYVWEAVDARLVAGVCRWAATSPAAAGEHFNVTNGDVFEWRNLWPAMTQTLGVEAGPDQPCEMARFLPAHAPAWDTIVQRRGLRPNSMEALLGESHHYADFCFAYGADQPPPPAFVSAVKLRQAGFTEFVDTEESFCFWLADLVERGILPDYS